ncbi:MAG: 2-C-methyl-D-erythritol 4-phosphate cytidylyltransferase [Smithella sp.]|jgi:2-C-methyl-D-erythritol 4-phosphate cytidylyltransferase/2-C-methyl-D-erythritol 2,4-cyclodiphosphate synthase
MKTVAIIPAGGAGTRLKSHVAKQFLLLDGLPILVHTLKVFQESNQIDDIIVAVPPDELVSIRQELIEKYNLTKVINTVAGGNQRQDSVKNCLEAVTGDCDMVVIHDAVRPFVTEDLIRQVVEAARITGAASAGVRAKDTIKETTEDNNVWATVPRHNLWLTQTPQAFKLELLKEAFTNAYDEKFYGTDDASLIERIGKEVKMVEGFYVNIKITTREDMMIADALMKKGSKISLRTGFGYDSHRFAVDRKLILGGVEIPFEKGLYGHSDADALIHAICDALLGAVGAGDIGRHFPDNDPQYKNVSSMILLEAVKKIIETRGFSINNIDATVVMETPKLAPYAAEMISNIASALNIAGTAVNIKAKTNEGMGFAGRNEGIAVFATVAVTERKNDGSKA